MIFMSKITYYKNLNDEEHLKLYERFSEAGIDYCEVLTSGVTTLRVEWRTFNGRRSVEHGIKYVLEHKEDYQK